MSAGSTELECKSCDANCGLCSDLDGICLSCTSSTKFYLDPSDKKCYVRCKLNEYRTSTNQCTGCPQNCQKCLNSTGICSECVPNYHLNPVKDCQRNCAEGLAFVPPDSCEACTDKNCKFCQDVTLACVECIEGYYISQNTPPMPTPGTTCKQKCRKGPFSDPKSPSFETDRKLTFQALSENNLCVDCKGSCQLCANVTLNCEDKEVNFEVKESAQTPPIHQLVFDIHFSDSLQKPFDLPLNRDYAFLFKLSEISKSKGTEAPPSLRRLEAVAIDRKSVV